MRKARSCCTNSAYIRNEPTTCVFFVEPSHPTPSSSLVLSRSQDRSPGRSGFHFYVRSDIRSSNTSGRKVPHLDNQVAATFQPPECESYPEGSAAGLSSRVPAPGRGRTQQQADRPGGSWDRLSWFEHLALS